MRCTPRRTLIPDPVLVISRLLISQYSWFFNRNASSAAPLPLMIGFASPPYLSITMGCCSVPDPFGQSWPVQVPPDLKRMWSPEAKVVTLSLLRLFQGVWVEVPASLSLPDNESM